jgi:hypothetical protein
MHVHWNQRNNIKGSFDLALHTSSYTFFIGVSVDQCYVVIAVSKSYSGTISKL